MNYRGKIVTYDELISIKSGENNEPLVSLSVECPDIICEYEKTDMIPVVGEEIYVRKSVAEKLSKINKKIKEISETFQLKVVYGYRHPDIQEKYFENKKNELKKKNPNLDEKEIKSLTHNFVAVPEVSGHPTGGAIDITIVDDECMVDMGTLIADFSDEEKIKTFTENITEEQKKNRMILHDAMISEEFAPFYGEWWHFSYGDKEWAFFYNKERSLYSPITLNK